MIPVIQNRNQMASLWTVAEHWLDPDEGHWQVAFPELHDLSSGDLLSEPFCFSCGMVSDAKAARTAQSLAGQWNASSGWLDRAHLVNHNRGGSGDASNLVPLCAHCHGRMPNFGEGRHGQALDWVRNRARIAAHGGSPGVFGQFRVMRQDGEEPRTRSGTLLFVAGTWDVSPQAFAEYATV